MDLNFLIDEILPQRKKEIEEGISLCTSQPIYVVLDLQENICSGHNEYSHLTNNKEKEQEHGYLWIDLNNDENREFRLTDEGDGIFEEVTRFWTDRFVAFFLTSKSAHDYLKYQSHNLTDAYVYVFNCGYKNSEMYLLLKGE